MYMGKAYILLIKMFMNSYYSMIEMFYNILWTFLLKIEL